MADSTVSDTYRWIEDHGDPLYRIALARVRARDVAEDLVQETFLAALQGTYRESGSTAERRWVIGIMKHIHVRMRMYLHLRMCVLCEGYKRQLRLMRDLLRKDGARLIETDRPQKPCLSAEAKERIQRALDSHCT